MAFVRRVWNDRISEYPNRRTINDGVTTKLVTVGRDEGNITIQGDAFNSTNMNDLERRIEEAFDDTSEDKLTELDDVNISNPINGQFLKYDSASQKWINATGGGATPWTDITGTLTAGQTSLTLSNEAIATSSTIDVYTDTYGVNPTAISVENGSVTLTFDEQAADLGVKVRVS